MKALMLTSSACEIPQHLGNLDQLCDEAFYRLLSDGQKLKLGPAMLTEEAFLNVAYKYVSRALDLHQCGQWGSCDRREVIANDKQLLWSGSVISRWLIDETLEFTINTDLQPGQEQTIVSVSPGSVSVCEAPSSLVPIGNLLLPDPVDNQIPYERIWSALQQHGTGSTGDDPELFSRECHFSSDTVHVSWWGESSSGEFYHDPFWLFTLNEHFPFTVVAVSMSSMFAPIH